MRAFGTVVPAVGAGFGKRSRWRRLGLALGLLTLVAPPLPAAPAFDDSLPPAPPDYGEARSWMVRDGGGTPGDGTVDVFYIHPTTYRSDIWNQDMADEAVNRWTDVSVGARQVSAFDACCRRFAPRYRQASSRAFREMRGDGRKAYALAYGDVLRAFRTYVAQENGGRPFILAGHSQGALHGLRLIREEIAGTPLAGRLVVAYLPGLAIPVADLPADLGPCDTPRRTGCVVSWNSFDADADVSAYVARARAGQAADAPLLCVNPLTFDAARPAAAFGAGKGALPGPAVEGALPPVVKGRVAARCDGGVFRVATRPDLSVERLPGGNLHMNDIAFFWADIRANAAVRIAAWRTGRTR